MGLFFVIALVLLRASNADAQETDCPPDQRVNCFVAPCLTARCATGYTCRNNYCGGCFADCVPATGSCGFNDQRYFDNTQFPDTDGCNNCTCNNRIITCTEETCPCSEGIVNCFDDPCRTQSCPHGYRCVSNFCGGCNAYCRIAIGSCEYNQRRYLDGERFDATDGCNTCTCDKGAVGCTEIACPQQCSYNGKTYNQGDSFPSGDGCNSCGCTNGRVICTLIACSPTCEYGGKTYKADDEFPSTDGCNDCSCTDTGLVACTKRGCITCPYNGKTYKPGDKFDSVDGCNECECTGLGGVSCTRRACAPQCNYGGKTYKVGDKFPSKDGCSKCSCSTTGLVKCARSNPWWLRYVKCKNACLRKRCGWWRKCKTDCKCRAKCVWGWL